MCVALIAGGGWGWGGRQQAFFDVGSVLSTPRPVRSDFDMKAKTSFRSFLSLPPSEPPLSELRLGTSECPQVFLVGCQGGKAQGWAEGWGLPPIQEGSLWGGGLGSQGRSFHSSQK